MKAMSGAIVQLLTVQMLLLCLTGCFGALNPFCVGADHAAWGPAM